MSRCSDWLGRFGALVLAVSVSVACGDDSTGPVEIDIDPADAATAMESLVSQFVEGNQAVQSVNVFTEAIFEALGVTPSIVALGMVPAPGQGSVHEIGRSLRASVTRAAGIVDATAGIPVGALGVWVFVPGSGYQLDPQRQAPPNTARFILYAVDPVNEEPIVPLEEIGFLDLTDNSQLPTIQISMTAEIGGVTLLDVDVTGAFTQSTLDMDFSGFLSDGTEQLDIDFSVNGTESSATVNFSLSVGTLTAEFSVTERDDNTGTFSITFTDGTDRIEFRLNVRSEPIGADFIDRILSGSTVRYNGRTVAVLSGTLDDPVITNAAGDPLTDEELQALRELFDATGDMFEVFQEILTFALVLLILGLA